jgi:hypothetical protein
VRISPIIDRLKPVRALVTLGGVLEFAGMLDKPGRLPAGFVVPEGATGSASTRATQVIDQKVSTQFAIVLILDGRRAGDAAVSDELNDIEAGILDCIVGWTHPDGSAPIQYVSSAALPTDPSAAVFAWAIRFRSSHHIRKAA